MFRYYATIVIAILLSVDLILILLAKYFVKQKPEENKYDRQHRVLNLNKWFYLVFLGLAVILILINLIF